MTTVNVFRIIAFLVFVRYREPNHILQDKIHAMN